MSVRNFVQRWSTSISIYLVHLPLVDHSDRSCIVLMFISSNLCRNLGSSYASTSSETDAQLSVQILISLSFLGLHFKLFVIIWASFLQIFHIDDPLLLMQMLSKHLLMLPDRYFFCIIFFHHASLPITTLHAILALRNKFIFIGSLTPAPPWILGLQAVSQFTKWNFFLLLSVLPPCHRNLLISL